MNLIEPAQIVKTDISLAIQHIELLTGAADYPCDFRLLHDSQKGEFAPCNLFGTVEDLWPEIEAAQRKGYGVFVVVNEGGQNDASISGTRALFIDGDDVPMPSRWHCPPSFIVKRSDIRWHAYWLVDGLPPDAFKPAQLRLAAHYGTDTVVCNPSRVMRLAGTMHMKDQVAPQIVMLEEIMGRWAGAYAADNVLSGVATVPVRLAEKRRAAAGVEIDHPRHIERFTQHLGGLVERGEVAIEGQHGDARTLQVANIGLDLGCSPETVHRLMLDHFNAHCVPPWETDELAVKVFNASRSRENDIGCDAADTRPGKDAFANVVKNAPPAISKGFETSGGLVLVRGSSLQPKSIQWLWNKRLPHAMLSLIAGHGNLGKTTILLDIASRVTRGAQWPDGDGAAKKGTVVYFSGEDSMEQTLLPRFLASGGDPEHIVFVPAVKAEDGEGRRTFDLKADLTKLEHAIAEIGDVELVIFDPISSYFGNADTWRTSQVRAVLEPVAEMADRRGVTIIGNTHFTKSGKGNANMRILDSVAMAAIARSIYVVVQDPDSDDRRLFLPSKWNLTKKHDGLAFTTFEKQVAADVMASHVIWKGGASQSADEALAASEDRERPQGAVDEAVEFLQVQLASGPKPVADVHFEAHQAGIALRTLKTAKRRLGIKSEKEHTADGRWIIELPGI